MKEKMMEQFSFTKEFKEKLVLLVMYRNQSVKEVIKSYQLPNGHILNNWITIYKKKLEKGVITLDPMDPKKKATPQCKLPCFSDHSKVEFCPQISYSKSTGDLKFNAWCGRW